MSPITNTDPKDILRNRVIVEIITSFHAKTWFDHQFVEIFLNLTLRAWGICVYGSGTGLTLVVPDVQVNSTAGANMRATACHDIVIRFADRIIYAAACRMLEQSQ